MNLHELHLDELVQLKAAQVVADDLGLRLSWAKTADGLIIGMGASHEGTVNGRRRTTPEHSPS